MAVTAGGLAVVNPRAFPLLPAFRSFYVGADEDRLPRAPARVVQGLMVGALAAARRRGQRGASSGVDALQRNIVADRVTRQGLGR